MCSLAEHLSDPDNYILLWIWDRGKQKGWGENRIRRAQLFMLARRQKQRAQEALTAELIERGRPIPC